MSEPEPSRPARDLYEWMNAMAGNASTLVASKSDRIVSVGWYVAASGKSSTGRDCVVDHNRIRAWLDIDRATIYRCVRRLVLAGWLVQTKRPARQRSSEAARRARYRLTIPLAVVDPTSRTDERDDATRCDDQRVANLDSTRRKSAVNASHDHAQPCDGSTSDGSTSDGSTAVGGSGGQAESVGDARGSSPRIAESVPREDDEPLDRVGETDGWPIPEPVDVRAHADTARAAIRAGAARARPNNGGRG